MAGKSMKVEQKKKVAVPRSMVVEDRTKVPTGYRGQTDGFAYRFVAPCGKPSGEYETYPAMVAAAWALEDKVRAEMARWREASE